MLQILEYILMWTGALTVIFIACKIPTWFGAMLEAGWRNQFPFDYLPALSRGIDFFEKNGFTKGNLIKPGSDKPGINMFKGENEIEIYLDSPLDAQLPPEMEIVFKEQAFKVRLPTDMTDIHAKLLTKVLTFINEKGEQA